MLEGVLSVVVLGLQLLGLGALALSQAPHWQRVLRARPFPGTRGLRLMALLILALALLVSVLDLGLAMGALFWLLAVLPCGLVVAWLLYKARS
ncbi:hypothetical protein C6A77_11985 [Pseudomonas sp. AFG_SD02_1510_Pfu_092]|uniref:DUF3325 family protein n=1 Tax=Pseudomonas sp. AFG_SD02_1510_Pfu_092 TaxID=2259497 RepID=UPI000DEF5457|nr:DUF3325 family protein [Pseudomonas sp. AFG_SD02_1510_Pfu_092]RCL26420.1 hypothetical protein C6A77_11985 [Pseudomonas sp. AFG_SD02_1510_Pfu_092]